MNKIRAHSVHAKRNRLGEDRPVGQGLTRQRQLRLVHSSNRRRPITPNQRGYRVRSESSGADEVRSRPHIALCPSCFPSLASELPAPQV